MRFHTPIAQKVVVVRIRSPDLTPKPRVFPLNWIGNG